ncbi:MAG: hypothetical protein RLZZ308_483 [Candidatus Parcubacteria bacterium]|jgi:hypothetical protein
MTRDTQGLDGLFVGKGQRLCDLEAMNQNLTLEVIQQKLSLLITLGLVEPYSHNGEMLYLLQE